MKRWIESLIRTDKPAETLRVNGMTLRIFYYRGPSEAELRAERLKYLPPSLPIGSVVAVVDDGAQSYWDVFESRDQALRTILR